MGGGERILAYWANFDSLSNQIIKLFISIYFLSVQDKFYFIFIFSWSNP